MRIMTTISLTVMTVLLPAVVRAEPEEPADRTIGVAPADAFEITIGQGYNQAFGHAANDNLKLQDLAGGGPSLQLGFGYRIDPRFFVGGYLEGARFSGGDAVPDDTHAYSGACGVQANVHFLPYSRIDPWIGLGTGFHGYWVDRPNAGKQTLYGWEIARLRVGADYRIGPSTSMGPMFGASLTTFLSEEAPTSEALRAIDDPGLSTFVFAGMQGRFDIGGERVSLPRASVASR